MIRFNDLIHGDLVLEVYEYELHGIRLFRYWDFPWKNRKERKKYLDDLEEQNTPESWKRAVELEIEIMLERFHMQFSRGLISFALGVVFALITITAQLNHFRLIIFLSGGITLLCFVFYFILRKRADNKRQEMILYKTLMSAFPTWPDPDNPEIDIPE